MTQKDNQTTQFIMEAIANRKPEKKELVTLRQLLIICSLALFIFCSAALTTLFIVDTVEKLQLLEFVERSPAEIFYKPGLTLIIMAAAFFGISYLFYRHTSLPFVKDRLKLILIIFSSIFLISCLGILIIQSNILGSRRPIRNFNQSLKGVLPYHEGIDQRKDFYTGRVISINLVNISIEGNQGRKEFIWNNNYQPLEEGELIVIRYNQNQRNQLIVKKIQVR